MFAPFNPYLNGTQMLYGDVVTLQPAGILHAPDSLKPVGIFENTTSYGVWVEDAVGTDSVPHLVISPIHPRFWPYLLRFELQLAGRPGAMAEAAEFLTQSRLNIQFGELLSAGHHHGTWIVVAEAVEVRRTFQGEIDIFQRERGSHNVRKLATDIAQEMYRTAGRIRKEMLDSELKRADTFLHRRFMNPSASLLHDPDEITDDENGARELARDDSMRVVHVRWMQDLPIFALYGTNALHPYVFKLNRFSSTLVPADEMTFEKILAAGRQLTDRPTRAIASIHPEEHHVRLIPIPSGAGLELLKVEVGYSASFPAMAPPRDAPASRDTTAGVWAGICETLSSRGINLHRVTNTTDRITPVSEAGVLTFIGLNDAPVEEEDIDGIISDLFALPHKLKDGERTLEITSKVSSMGVDQVFISLRLDAPRRKELSELARNAALAQGLNPVFVEIEGPRLTDTVTAEILRCNAMFQILTFSDEEMEQKRRAYTGEIQPQLHWMLYEYGVAAGGRLQITRAVDISRSDVASWQRLLRIGGDDVLAAFRLDENTETIRASFDESMRKLAERLRSARSRDRRA